jgi:pyruvate formate lyase activating enzyme
MNSNIKESLFQRRLQDKTAQCLTCERQCLIKDGQLGYCQTRKNIDRNIYTIVYGKIPAISLNPIEKKPFFHFYPGSKAITVGTYGCNLNCFWCQNHHLSHPLKPIKELVESTNYISPNDLIEIALRKHARGTSISFNEPTLLFEYSLDVFKKAKKHGLYNTYVSNGYMTEKVLKTLIEAGLDAINIDIKGDSEMVKKYCGVNVEKIWRNALIVKEFGVHLEITTLLIEKYNTSKEILKNIAERIKTELGSDTPLHLTRFFPHYRSSEYGIETATPLESLYQAHKVATDVGLKYVYLGNITSIKYETTYCPSCGNKAIGREGFLIRKTGVDKNGKCKICGFKILNYF